MSATKTKTVTKVLQPKPVLETESDDVSTDDYYNQTISKAKELIGRYVNKVQDLEDEKFVLDRAVEKVLEETRALEEKNTTLNQQLEFYRSQDIHRKGAKLETSKIVQEMFDIVDTRQQRKVMTDEEREKRAMELLKKKRGK